MATIETTREGSILSFKTPIGVITLDTAKVSAENRELAMYHGFTQKVSDAAAMSRNPETGLPATPADKHARMLAVAERIVSGAWNATREATGGELFRAMKEVYPTSAHLADAKTFAAHVAKLAETAGVTKTAIMDKLAAAKPVKKVLDRYLAERTKGIDESKLLDGFSE